MKIRIASVADSTELLKIYEQYIDTAITFEYVLPSEREFTQRIEAILPKYPYLVCQEQDKIMGYAYAHKNREREAYQWGAELSIYLDKTAVSKGVGRKMYSALIELLQLQGVKTTYGAVTMPNEKSEKLHLGLGFRELGTYHNTGYKCGSWHDVRWYEKHLGVYDTNPEPIKPLRDISKNEVEIVLKKYTDRKGVREIK